MRIANSTPASAVKIIAIAERQRVQVAVVDAHQLGGVGIVGGGAEGAAEAGAIEQKLQAADRQHRHREHQQRIDPDRDAARKLQARGLDRALLQPVGVGAEALQQPVLDDHRNAEGDEQRRQQPAAEREVQQAALQRVAEHEHHRHDDDEAGDRIEPGAVDRRPARHRPRAR